LLLCDQKKII